MMRIRPGDKVHCGSWTGPLVGASVDVAPEASVFCGETVVVSRKTSKCACISTKWNLIDHYSVTQPTRSDYM